MEKQIKTTINWYPGHMAKATREIEQRVKMVDLIIELRDARAPLSTANPVIAAIENKPHLVILTKIDLADPKQTEGWVQRLSTPMQRAIPLNLLAFHSYGSIVNEAKALLQDKMQKEQAKGLKPRPIRALVVGIPNVGKSTLINRLAKRKAAITGDRPGVTKAQQIIKVSKDFELFDTPGILWPKFDDLDTAMHIALVGSIKDTILPHDEIYIYALRYLAQYYPALLFARYQLKINLEKEDWVEQSFVHLSNFRHFSKVRQELDYDRIMNMVFHDILKGAIGKVSWQRFDE